MSDQSFAAQWRWLRALAALVIALTSLLQIAPAMAAGPVSLTTLDVPYTQNFDILANTGTPAWADNSTLSGWYAQFGVTANPTTYTPGTGSTTSGALYSYGSTAATDRALGSVGSGTTGDIYWAIKLSNDTGSTITSLDVSYMGEQWRAGGCTTPCTPAAQTVDFQYQVTNAGLFTDANSPTTGWLDQDPLDFTSPTVGTSTAATLDGNAAANRTNLSSTISVNVAAGQEVWLRWKDINHPSNDHGLSIDNFSVTPHSLIQQNLTIDDVSLNEGNSGTTSFLFTASLSAPAGPGGVTFDIATADNTATVADSDYTANSLIGQFISAGNSTYNFTVLVNGDTADEPNETFSVNVTNVTGADTGDGQGQGTIQNDDAPVQPPAGSVVISEVYGGGGNGSAPFKNDFIELYNRTASPISLAGWSVQYAGATGSTWQVTPLTGSIGPGKYYLVAEAAGTSCSTLPCGVDLPAPDAAGSILMNGTAGKVALVQNSTPLTGSCPTGLPISDFVGYGTTANCSEGSGPTPTPSNTTAVIRLAEGSTDTDNNAADFATGAPDPDNSADVAPTVTNTTPANGAANVLVSSNIDVTFSEPVNASGSSFTISCGTSGAHTAAVTGGPTTYILNPDTDFVTTETCTVTVVAVQVTDQDSDDPPDNMTADFGFSFSTEGPVCSQTFTPIYSIQGSGSTAAITGNVTTQGVVVGDFETAAGLQGFYIQDPTGDGDPATSDGLFVFTGTANTVNAGDVVRVTASARERFNMTALNGSNDNAAAVPAGNIVNCGSGTVAVTDVSMPFASTTFLERYEGMYVRFPQSLVISEYFNYDQFGEIVLALPLAGEPRPFSGTAIDEPGSAANARTLANSLRRITLDDGKGGSNPSFLRHPNGAAFALDNLFRGGDQVQNAIGVLSFDFNLYRIIPTAPANYTSVNPRPVAPEPVGGSLRVAAMNALNFFLTLDTTASDSGGGPCGGNANLDCRGADSSQPDEFPRQRTKLLAALAGLDADVIGLNELENTPGVDPLGDPTNGIVAGLNAQFGPGTYSYINTGVIGTDAIRVGLIYRPAVITPVGTFQILDSTDDPRFIDTRSRPALAQTFEEVATGARFTVVVNHLKSKGSACTGDPDAGDGQGNCNGTRTLAAQALVDWLATDPTSSGDPDFLIVGDLNSYAQEAPIDAIKAGSDDTVGTSDDFTNLIFDYQGAYAYSYTFDGQAGYLDHALANASLAAQITGAADWHINSDEPDVVDYDTSFKPAAQEALYEPNPYRSSDHDPVIVGLDLTVPDKTAPDTTIDSSPSNPSNSSSASFTFSGTDDASGSSVASFECQLDAGSFSACTSPQNYSSLADGSHTFQVRAIDGVGNIDPTPASFTWTIDAIAPSVTINQAAGQVDPTSNSPINFEVVFNEPVTGFTDTDVTLSGTAGATTAAVTGSGATYNVAVSGMTANGTVTASIAAGSATDAAGNSNTASTSTDNTITFANAAPTVVVAAGGMCGSSGGTMNLTVNDANGNPLTLSGSSSNTGAVPNANIVFGGSGSNRTVAITAVPAATVRTAIVTVTVNDGLATASVTITVLVGTSGNNTTLNGTSGADLILGLGGNDTLSGLAGNDLLCGGSGNDTINGGDNDDTLDGDIGNDVLNGGAGNDGLFGRNGNDSLTGGTGADDFDGGPNNDTVTDFNAGQGDTKVNIP